MAGTDILLINGETMNSLSAQATGSERKRMNLDMRNSSDDQSQRMLNALEPETVLPIHRHTQTSETLVVIRGAVEQRLYDDNGNITALYIFKAGTDNIGMNVPAGCWHNTIALEYGTVIFEAKDGAYAPLTEEDVLK